MNDSNKNNTGWKLHGYKTRRQWTTEEIREAANYEHSEIWQELLAQEEATSDSRELAAVRIAGAMLRELHTNIDSMDVSKLFCWCS